MFTTVETARDVYIRRLRQYRETVQRATVKFIDIRNRRINFFPQQSIPGLPVRSYYIMEDLEFRRWCNLTDEKIREGDVFECDPDYIPYSKGSVLQQLALTPINQLIESEREKRRKDKV